MAAAQTDLMGLSLEDGTIDEVEKEKFKERPGLGLKVEEIIAKARKEEADGRRNISLIVVGRSRVGVAVCI